MSPDPMVTPWPGRLASSAGVIWVPCSPGRCRPPLCRRRRQPPWERCPFTSPCRCRSGTLAAACDASDETLLELAVVVGVEGRPTGAGLERIMSLSSLNPNRLASKIRAAPGPVGSRPLAAYSSKADARRRRPSSVEWGWSLTEHTIGPRRRMPMPRGRRYPTVTSLAALPRLLAVMS